MRISVKSDVRNALRMLRKAQRIVVPQAVAAALNRAGQQSRTAILREVSAAKQIPQKVLRRRIRYQRRDRATPRKLEARIFAIERAVPLAETGKPRQLRKGAGAGRHFVPGAFVATIYRNYTGIYKRKGPPRFPVEAQMIPISDVVGPIAERAIRTVGLRTFQRRFYHELNRRLMRKGLR